MTKDLVYDRSLRELTAPDRASKVRARALQAAHRALAPVGYLGVSRVFGLINRLLPAQRDMLVKEGDFHFGFPADDYYWSRLLDAQYEYEPEIDRFLAALGDTDFLFVDLGANFGYWSTRVAAGVYGRRRVVAVEASIACFEVLYRNLDRYGVAAAAFHYAVADRSGAEVRLFGERHAGFSIDPGWGGASSAVADVVSTTTLDDVLREAGVDPSAIPLVVKVDVEGVEKQVLDGAAETVAGSSVFLIEDSMHPRRVGDAVRHAYEHLGMRLYSMDGIPLRRLGRLDDVLEMKRRQSRFQHTGMNIVATASRSWWDVLDRVGAARSTESA